MTFPFPVPAVRFTKFVKEMLKLHQAVSTLPLYKQAWWQVEFGLENKKLAPLHGVGQH